MKTTKCDRCGFEIGMKTSKCVNCGQPLGITAAGAGGLLRKIIYILIIIAVIRTVTKIFGQ